MKTSIVDYTAGRQIEWDDYVLTHPRGAIFHTSAMYRSFLGVPGHSPMYMAALDGQGNIIAMLCSVRVTVSSRLPSWTGRSLMYVEPICNDSKEGSEGLLELLRIHDECAAKEALFSEVRPLNAPGKEREVLERAGYSFCQYYNYIQDLTEGMEALGQRAKKVKRKVERAFRRGAEVQLSSCDPEAIEKAYNTIAFSYHRAKVPLASIQLFQSAQEHLPCHTMQVRGLYLEGEQVAASIGLVYKDRYFAWYNGTRRPQGMASAAVLVWDEMRQACQLGLRLYDFGGAGWPKETYGPRTFKSRFKGALVNHGRYRKVNSKLKLNVAKCGYHLLRGAISTPPVNPPTAER